MSSPYLGDQWSLQMQLGGGPWTGSWSEVVVLTLRSGQRRVLSLVLEDERGRGLGAAGIHLQWAAVR